MRKRRFEIVRHRMGKGIQIFITHFKFTSVLFHSPRSALLVRDIADQYQTSLFTLPENGRGTHL